MSKDSNIVVELIGEGHSVRWVSSISELSWNRNDRDVIKSNIRILNKVFKYLLSNNVSDFYRRHRDLDIARIKFMDGIISTGIYLFKDSSTIVAVPILRYMSSVREFINFKVYEQ